MPAEVVQLRVLAFWVTEPAGEVGAVLRCRRVTESATLHKRSVEDHPPPFRSSAPALASSYKKFQLGSPKSLGVSRRKCRLGAWKKTSPRMDAKRL